VPGGWHHGDDIFANLGTPVVAVADGTLNRVGWERLGGWRLWVRDRVGDEFYYAHLSGYSMLALRSKHVKAGEVLGFVGNTGDAFTTVPHLHFEIHPRSLLHLGYDGAVDPTSYLRSWPHMGKFTVGRPVHPRLPTEAAWRFEAQQNFRELLHARGLTHHPALLHARGLTHDPALQPVAAPTATPHAHALPTPAAMPLPVAAAPVKPTPSRRPFMGLLAVVAAVIGLAAALGWRSWAARRPRAGS
jgi:hypothetical protein